jgi:alpha-mannosidase
VRAGLELNVPLRAAPAARGAGGLGTSASFVSCDAPGVVLEALKRAEDSDALVLRLYEAHGARARARLALGLPATAARETDLLERGGRPLRLRRRGAAAWLELDFRPFEIKTVVLELGRPRRPRGGRA